MALALTLPYDEGRESAVLCHNAVASDEEA
jgi:hypothetical protein